MTIRRAGISSGDRASVLDQTRPPKSNPGMGAGSDPAAMTMSRAFTVTGPSAVSTWTVPPSTNDPEPFSHSTDLDLNSIPIPPVSLWTIPSFQVMSLDRSSDGVSTVNPIFEACSACSKK